MREREREREKRIMADHDQIHVQVDATRHCSRLNRVWGFRVDQRVNRERDRDFFSFFLEKFS